MSTRVLLTSREAEKWLAERDDGKLEELRALADEERSRIKGDVVTYVVNRNVNFSNICVNRCKFCAYRREEGHPEAFLLSVDEILEKIETSLPIGITEVCVQGGLHPKIDLSYYLEITSAIRKAFPDIHIHAFSPMEVKYAAKKSRLSVREVLSRLQAAGLNTIPGTAAEILDDKWRGAICPEKLTAQEWEEVVTTAHELGVRSTATILCGFHDSPSLVVKHMETLKRIQEKTGGFTEFVPLPYVPEKVGSRDALKLYAVSRLFLAGYIDNLQVSWPKLGPDLARESLGWGVNDVGGTLIEENISRSAGAPFGQEISVDALRKLISAAGRKPAQRDTVYNLIESRQYC